MAELLATRWEVHALAKNTTYSLSVGIDAVREEMEKAFGRSTGSITLHPPEEWVIMRFLSERDLSPADLVRIEVKPTNYRMT